MPATSPEISSPLLALASLGECIERYHATSGIPHVTITYAQTLDGSIAARDGSPFPISCEQARVFTHRLRAAHDAILVGIGTIISDDPRLNTRLVEGGNPLPVILDSELRIDPRARVLSSPRKPVIFTSVGKTDSRTRALERRGVRIECVESDKSGVNLEHMLKKLSEYGVRSLMVEGGPQVIRSFLEKQLVQRFIVTFSLKWMDGMRIFSQIGTNGNPFPSTSCRPIHLHWAGSDLVMHGTPEW